MASKEAELFERECELWDPYVLYSLAVQDPVSPTIGLMKRIYRRLRGRQPRILREDFCGTALFSCEWIRQHGANRAIGIDIDPAPLAWAREHYLPQLSEEQRTRLDLRAQDVREPVDDDRPDFVCAFNFSFMLFTTRLELMRYFASVRRTMAPDGLFFVDLFGGSEAQGEVEESTDIAVSAEDVDSPLLGHLLDDRTARFTYWWHQAWFNPVTHHMGCKIHFEFPDDSRRDDAFTYEWRLWTIPEIRELLTEAGFSSSEVHWQEHDEEGEFLGYKQTDVIADDPAWIVTIAAIP